MSERRRASLFLRLMLVVIVLLMAALVFVLTWKSIVLLAGAAYMFRRAGRIRRGENRV